MNLRRLIWPVLAAISLSLVVALVPSEQQRISVDIWLTAAALAVAVVVGRAALNTVADDRPQWRSAIRFDRGRGDTRSGTGVPIGLHSLEGALLAAARNDRAFSLRLQPRLIDIALHRMRVDHGIDGQRDPDAMAAALGDMAWLVDRRSRGRAPTVEEVERFLDRLDAAAIGQREGS